MLVLKILTNFALILKGCFFKYEIAEIKPIEPGTDNAV